MRYGVLAVLFLVSTLFLPPVVVQAAPAPVLPDDILDKEIEQLDFSDFNVFINQLDQEIKDYIPDLDMGRVLDNLRKGEFSIDLKEFFVGLVRYFFKEVLANSTLLGTLIVLAIVGALMQNITVSFEQGTVSKLAYAICFLVLVTIAVSSFTLAINIGEKAINNMVSFMHALLPLLLTLLTATGAVVSVAILHPFIFLAINLLSILVRDLVFPLIFCASILNVVNFVSERFQVSRLSGLLKDACVVILGFSLTVFVGLLSVQGVAGAVSDGVTLRTAKYASGAFIPIVGGMFSDAVEVVIGCSLFLKNAFGIVGLFILFVLCLFPIIKILSIVLIYRLAAALVQPLGDGQIVDTLQALSGNLLLVFAAVAAVGLMFFVGIAIIVAAGDLTAAFR